MVIEQPEDGIFFIDAFGIQAFQRVSDIDKVETETLMGYMVMAGNVWTPENQRFCVRMRKMISECPDKDKLQSKRVKFNHSVSQHLVNEVPELKKKAMGPVSRGNKLIEPYTISSTFEEPKDKSLKNKRDKSE
ncbi:hypothetical protein Tco_0775463 [Tanacetum coccineum]